MVFHLSLTYQLFQKQTCYGFKANRPRHQRIFANGEAEKRYFAPAIGAYFYPEELEKEKEDILIGAFDEDDLLACCMLTKSNHDSLRLRQMAVQNNLQGKGIGASMLNFAEILTKDKGYNKIIMHARETATGFYEKLGYQIVGDKFTEVTIPHYIMEKKL